MSERDPRFRLPWLVSEGEWRAVKPGTQTLEAPLSLLHWEQGVSPGLRLPPCTCLALGA